MRPSAARVSTSAARCRGSAWRRGCGGESASIPRRWGSHQQLVALGWALGPGRLRRPSARRQLSSRPRMPLGMRLGGLEALAQHRHHPCREARRWRPGLELLAAAAVGAVPGAACRADGSHDIVPASASPAAAHRHLPVHGRREVHAPGGRARRWRSARGCRRCAVTAIGDAPIAGYGVGSAVDVLNHRDAYSEAYLRAQLPRAGLRRSCALEAMGRWRGGQSGAGYAAWCWWRDLAAPLWRRRR